MTCDVSHSDTLSLFSPGQSCLFAKFFPSLFNQQNNRGRGEGEQDLTGRNVSSAGATNHRLDLFSSIITCQSLADNFNG